MSAASKLVVVHADDGALDALLGRGGLRKVLSFEHLTVWLADAPGPVAAPAAEPVPALPPARATGSPPLLLTVVQAAAVLGIGRTSAYQLIGAGQLEVVHVGRSVRVPAEALPELLSRLRSAAAIGTAPGRPSPARGRIRSVAGGGGSQPRAARTA